MMPMNQMPMNQMPMNPMQILRAVQNGANPNQLVAQLAQSNPAIRQAMQLMSGKTPVQIRDMVQQQTQRRGVDLNRLAQQWGVQLPK
jgi:hypothetical protein